MAEVQTHTESGEMTQRFIEFVMMTAQNAAHFLGQIPNPQTGKGEVNLDLARLFIDQLVMIRSKTRGNLSQDETGVLNNAISNLQMVFVEVSRGGGVSEEIEEPATPVAPAVEAGAAAPESPEEGEPESKKKFTKSYGA
ncbi:MAG: DUF1844 domain-containing protein [Chthoniobacteraceae bacterium]